MMNTRLAIHALCAFAILCGLSIFAAADVVNYTRLRKRVTGRELINNGAQVVYTYQQGAKVWQETNTVQRINAPRSIRYSKLKLIVAAKAAGKYKGKPPMKIDKELFEKLYGEVKRKERTATYAMGKLGVKRNTWYVLVRSLSSEPSPSSALDAF